MFVMKVRLPLRRTPLLHSLALLCLLLGQWRPESRGWTFSCQKTSSQPFYRHRDDTYGQTGVSGVSWFSRRTWNSRRAWRSLGGNQRTRSEIEPTSSFPFNWSHMTSLNEPIRAHHGPWRASGSIHTVLSLRALEAQED